MRFAPQRCGNAQGIDSMGLPPGALIAAAVEFTMVQPTEGNGEAVANFPTHRPLLRKLDMMGIRRGSTAEETRLRSHKFQVLAITFSHRFADDGDRLFDWTGLQ
jgi:hypothetical protein